MKKTLSRIVKRIAIEDRNKKKRFMPMLAKTYTSGYNNMNYDARSNGEYYILDSLLDCNLKTMFDVGANVGDWTTYVYNNYKKANIFSFEIVPSTFNLLKHNICKISVDNRVKLFDFGLSDVSGSFELDYYGEGSGINTIITNSKVNDCIPTKLKVKARDGQTFFDENNIETIDFLKIDTEGSEHLVLKGFNGLLKTKRINVIQFEYGLINIDTKFLLKDYYQLLGENYRIGKLYPKGVDFCDYRYSDEDFIGPNYIAVLKEETKLIEAIAIK